MATLEKQPVRFPEPSYIKSVRGKAFYVKLQQAVEKGNTHDIECLLLHRKDPLAEKKILSILQNAIRQSEKFALEALLNSPKIARIIRTTDWVELLKLCCREGIRRSYPFLCVWENARDNGMLINNMALEVAFEVAKMPEDPGFSLQKFKEIWGRMLDYKYIKTKLLSSKDLFVAVWNSTLKTKRDMEVMHALLYSFLNEFDLQGTLTGIDLQQMYELPLQDAVAHFEARIQTVTKPCWKDFLSTITRESMPHMAQQVPVIQVHLADDSDEAGTAFGHRFESSSCPTSVLNLPALDEVAIAWKERHSHQCLRSRLSDLTNGSLQIPSWRHRLNKSPHPSLYSIDSCYSSPGGNVVKIFSITDYGGSNFRPRPQSASIPDLLEAVFHNLGCSPGDVEIFRNPTAEEIVDVVKMICLEAKGTLRDASSLHFYVMAHGSFSKIFGTGGSPIKECDITSPICEAFPNIPKFFVFQKCQKGSGENGLSIQESYPVNNPEMCVVHTCMPGCQDFDDQGGSLFMRTLIDNLKKYGSGWDYLRILQHTSKKLAKCGQKPVVCNTLTKNFYFKPNSEV